MFKIKLKKARENAGLTQIQLSKKLGLSSGAVGNWEAGTREPDLKTIGRIASILEIKVSDLVDIDAKEKAMPDLHGLDPEKDRAYFSAMADLKKQGLLPHDLQIIGEVYKAAKERDKKMKK